MPHPSFTCSLETVAGRTLRIGSWNWQTPCDHPPVLIINGIGANLETLEPLVGQLGNRPILSFDPPGVGESPVPVLPYSLPGLAATIRNLLKRYQCEQIDLVGISWGGALAQQMALSQPEQVRRLVLCATSTGAVMVPPLWPTGLHDAMRTAAPLHPSGEPLWPRLPGFVKPSARGFAYQVGAMLGWTSIAHLPQLRHETLILMGDRDRIVPAINGQIMAQLIRNSRLDLLKGAGHLFPYTKPHLAGDRIRTFFDQPAPATAKQKVA